MKTLTLSNGNTVEVNDASTTTVLFIDFDRYSLIDTVRRVITEESLKNATLTDSQGNVEELINIIPVNITASSGYEGDVNVRYNLRAKTELELIREELNALHEEQEIQDEAIDFLAMQED